jgi:hypothetical protein
MAPRLLSTVFLSAAVQVVWSTDSVNTSSYTQLYFGILFVRGCCWQLQTYCTAQHATVYEYHKTTGLPACHSVCLFVFISSTIRFSRYGLGAQPFDP